MTLPEGLSEDAFLGGQLQIRQPKDGFRASTDAVLMAAAVPAQSGETVLDVGCGVGTASMCLLNRIAVVATGLEIQEDYADLAVENAGRNNRNIEVVKGSLFQTPTDLKERVFDHVMTNPPFFDAKDAVAPQAIGKATAHVSDDSLSEWVRHSLKRLKQGGYFTTIMRTDRLPELLTATSDGCGAIRILPIASRKGSSAKRVIIQARKAIKAPTELLGPFVMHEGQHHDGDRDSYTKAAKSVLREGMALSELQPK